MKKIIATIVCLVMSLQMMTGVFAKEYPQRFYDVPKDHWAFEYIAELVDRGVIAGYEDGSFKPNKTVSRAEFAKIMVGAAGIVTADNSLYFTDMQGHWAIPYVNAAREYLTAYADNTYRPNQAAVREDVTIAMVKLKGYDVSDVDFSYLSGFTDTDSISNNVKTYVAVAVEKGLINGFEDNTFRGQGTLTRAEAATLLWKAFQYGNDNKVSNAAAVTQSVDDASQVKNNEQSQVELQKKDENEEKAVINNSKENEEEKIVDVKPYAVNTVLKANVSSSHLFTVDDDDNIYFLEDDIIYKSNIYKKSKEEFFDISLLEVDTEEMSLSDLEIYNIIYDTVNHRLLVQGKYQNINSSQKVKNNYLYSISNGDYELIDDNYNDETYICGVLNNGELYSRYTDYKDYAHRYYNPRDFGNVCLNNGKIYMIRYEYLGYYTANERTYDYYLYSYDFVRDTEEFKLDHYLVAGTVYNGFIYTLGNKQTFEKYNFKGKKIGTISFEDIEIKDYKELSTFNFAMALIVTSNDDIVFYDTSAKAFRIVKDND